MNLLELIPEIYDAAADPDRWPSLLDRISDLIDGRSSTLVLQDMRTGTGQAVYSRVDPDFFQQYFTRFAHSNVLLQNTYKLHSGNISFERDVVSREVLERSEYYRELLLPYDVPHLMCLTVWREPHRIGILNVTRGQQDESFGDGEKDVCRVLMPHLQRAFVIASRLQDLEARAQGGLAALEKVSWGAILVNSENRISFANAIAEAILRRGDGLAGRSGALSAHTPEDNARLARAMDLARHGEGSAIRIARSGTASPYVLLVTPLGTRQGWLGIAEQAVLIAVTDPERPPNVDIERLRSLYGLTTAEAALAARLATGNDLSQIARQLGIKHETARTHLKHAFSKLGVSRQSELVSKVVREAMIFTS